MYYVHRIYLSTHGDYSIFCSLFAHNKRGGGGGGGAVDRSAFNFFRGSTQSIFVLINIYLSVCDYFLSIPYQMTREPTNTSRYYTKTHTHSCIVAVIKWLVYWTVLEGPRTPVALNCCSIKPMKIE